MPPKTRFERILSTDEDSPRTRKGPRRLGPYTSRPSSDLVAHHRLIEIKGGHAYLVCALQDRRSGIWDQVVIRGTYVEGRKEPRSPHGFDRSPWVYLVFGMNIADRTLDQVIDQALRAYFKRGEGT